jgi:hypothetical protein
LIDEAAWCSLGKAGVAAGSVLLLTALALRALFDRLGSSTSISAQSGKYSQVLIRGTNGERVSSCIITISEELGSDFVVLGSQLTREQQVRTRSARVHCLRTDRCRDAMTVLLLLLLLLARTVPRSGLAAQATGIIGDVCTRVRRECQLSAVITYIYR